MMESQIIVSILSGLFTVLATVITVLASSKKNAIQTAAREAAKEAKDEEWKKNVEKKLDEHNGYARLFHENIPALTEQIKYLSKDVDEIKRKVNG